MITAICVAITGIAAESADVDDQERARVNDIKRMKEKKAAAMRQTRGPMPHSQRPTTDDGPSRGVVLGFVFVIVLVLTGLYVVQTMIDTARIQDCAASGRRDC